MPILSIHGDYPLLPAKLSTPLGHCLLLQFTPHQNSVVNAWFWTISRNRSVEKRAVAVQTAVCSRNDQTQKRREENRLWAQMV